MLSLKVRTVRGTFEPLIIGTSGNVTKPTMKLLRTICSKQDANDSTVHRYNFDFWMAKISFSLQKTIANEIIIRSPSSLGEWMENNIQPITQTTCSQILLIFTLRWMDKRIVYCSLIYLSLGWHIRPIVCTVILQAP